MDNEKNNSIKVDKGALIAVIVVVVLGLLMWIPCMLAMLQDSGSSGSNSSLSLGYKECPICHRSFEQGTSDYKSIVSTHMCRNCYRNYEWAHDNGYV